MKRVEYQTSRVDFYEGIVMEHDQQTGRVVLIDVDDGSRWQGRDDQVTVLED